MIIKGILWILVGWINGFKDRSALGRYKRAYWNKSEGWIYKWKLDEDGKRIPQTGKKWYYLWIWTPKYKARFAYSSTLLVFLTDGWHLLQFIQFKCAALATVITYEIMAYQLRETELFLALSACFGLGFWHSYERKEK